MNLLHLLFDPPSVEYCSRCGVQKVAKPYADKFDWRTGKKLKTRYYYICPVHEADLPEPIAPSWMD